MERMNCYLPARNGEDTVAGQRGILDLDHDLDRSGPATSKPSTGAPFEIPEIPESDFGPGAEITDDELIMNVNKTVCSPMARRNEGIATRYLRRREPAGGSGCLRKAGRMVPPRRGGGALSSVTLGVARRHPGLLEWHPSRMAGSAPVLRSGSATEDGLRRVDCTYTAYGGEAPNCRNNGCGFVLEDIGGEMVMRRNCPEIGEGGSACWGFCLGAFGGREFCRLGSRRYSRLGNLRYTWRNVVPPGCKPSPFTLPSQDEDTGWGFVLQDAGGKWLMSQDCPEFFDGAGSASSAAPSCYLPAHCGEDTEVGQRGILDLDHDLDRSGPATSKPLPGAPFETPEIPESGLWFKLQDTRGECVLLLQKVKIRRSCPAISRRGHPRVAGAGDCRRGGSSGGRIIGANRS